MEVAIPVFWRDHASQSPIWPGSLSRAWPAAAAAGSIVSPPRRYRYAGARRHLERQLGQAAPAPPAAWLDERQPDVVCLQETKLADEAFDELLGDELPARGYAIARHGEAQWNGVAILSRVGLEDVVAGIRARPGFPHAEARAVSATCGGIRVHCVYVPNGRKPDSEHYRYKLAWLAALGESSRAGPRRPGVRRHEHRARPTSTSSTRPPMSATPTSPRPSAPRWQSCRRRPARRRARPLAARARLHLLGLPRRHVPSGPRHAHRPGAGRAPVAERVRAAWVDRQARKGSGPSDHAPVIVDLDEAPDGDIGPVVPPPSAPAARSGSAKLPQSS